MKNEMVKTGHLVDLQTDIIFVFFGKVNKMNEPIFKTKEIKQVPHIDGIIFF